MLQYNPRCGENCKKKNCLIKTIFQLLFELNDLQNMEKPRIYYENHNQCQELNLNKRKVQEEINDTLEKIAVAQDDILDAII